MNRFKKYYKEFPSIGLAMDLSKVQFEEEDLAELAPRLKIAFDEMNSLERGAIANPDEKRMVGHYWLRCPSLAPDAKITNEINATLAKIKSFSNAIHKGEICAAAGPFNHLLIIGIGGSALGPQFVSRALGKHTSDKLKTHFFDNTDPDGMDEVLSALGKELSRTLCIIISKSGGTKETRNGMLEAESAFTRTGLEFSKHAVAVTGIGSDLDNHAIKHQWLERFPMWDWVGGRTSVTSAVGLLPAALQGIDIDSFLQGAREYDELTRKHDLNGNPAGWLAMMWFLTGNGRGERAMVVIPYKDRLELFSKYLQQLVMESLGKERDLDGKVVHQGLTVYGNKGSTDQHAYVQQLRDGIANFFAVFVEVLHDRLGPSIYVEDQITSGDYLFGFLLGTQQALSENQRPSITLTIDQINPYQIGGIIALFERAVGFYASMIRINAYHQPGVEAGKKAAARILKLQTRIIDFLRSHRGEYYTAFEISEALATDSDAEIVFKICQHLKATEDRGIESKEGPEPLNRKFCFH